MDTKEVEALAERMARQFITSHMRPDDIRLWEKSALVLAQVAYHWRDETRPVQAPPATLEGLIDSLPPLHSARDDYARLLVNAPPAAAVSAEPVAWQYRFATPDGLTWSDWQPTPSEEMARKTVDLFGTMGTRAEWRSLKVFEWGGYAGEVSEADFVEAPPTPAVPACRVCDGSGKVKVRDAAGEWEGNCAHCPPAAVPADQEPLCFGPGNYYGSLEIRCKDGVPEWCVESYSGHHWEPCPRRVYDELLAAANKENNND